MGIDVLQRTVIFRYVAKGVIARSWYEHSNLYFQQKIHRYAYVYPYFKHRASNREYMHYGWGLAASSPFFFRDLNGKYENIFTLQG